MEALVNGWIAEGHPVTTREMAIDDARAAGALAMFDEKYGATVRVRPHPEFPQPSSPPQTFPSLERLTLRGSQSMLMKPITDTSPHQFEPG